MVVDEKKKRKFDETNEIDFNGMFYSTGCFVSDYSFLDLVVFRSLCSV